MEPEKSMKVVPFDFFLRVTLKDRKRRHVGRNGMLAGMGNLGTRTGRQLQTSSTLSGLTWRCIDFTL